MLGTQKQEMSPRGQRLGAVSENRIRTQNAREWRAVALSPGAETMPWAS